MLSVILTAVLLLSVRGIVSVMSTPEEAVEGTVRYLIVCFLGIPFITAYNIISSIFRAWEIPKVPCTLSAVACGVNIVLGLPFHGSVSPGTWWARHWNRPLPGSQCGRVLS